MKTQTTASIIASLLLGLNSIATQAVPILTAPTLANYYHCLGKNTNLVLRTSTPADTTLTLTLNTIVHKAKGTDIETESTVFGDLKEITIGFKPDISITKASVIIPIVVLGPNLLQTKFKSQLVVTNVMQSMIATPVEGINNASTYIDLVCKASVLD